MAHMELARLSASFINRISDGSAPHSPTEPRGRSSTGSLSSGGGPKRRRRSSLVGFSEIIVDETPTPLGVIDSEEEPVSSELTAAINLTKNLIGAGMFTLPRAFSRASVLLGFAMLMFCALMSAAGFVLIARNCRTLGCSTYREMGVKAIGPRFGFVIDICIMTNGILAPLSYLILACDFFEGSIPPLIGWHPSRWLLAILNTCVIILPLCYLRDLSSLRIPSMIALLIVAVIFFNVVGDSLSKLQASLSNFKEGAFYLNLGLFFSTSVFNGSYAAHYNSPIFYKELGCDLAIHTRATIKAFGLSTVVYVCFAFAGYGLFGDDVHGNVLKNYGISSGLFFSLALFSMAFSITLTFPLAFNACRLAFFGLFPAAERARSASPKLLHYAVTTVIVLGICAVACVVDEVQVVFGLRGALLSPALGGIIPGIVHLQMVRTNPQGQGESKRLTSLAVFLVLWGFINQVIGALVVLGVLK